MPIIRLGTDISKIRKRKNRAMANNRTKRKRASARKAAENATSGYASTTVVLPKGLGYFEMKPGVYDLDFIEFEVGKGNPNADAGEWYYERTFYVYKGIGVKEQWFCSLADTFNKKDPIAEWRNNESRSGNADPDTIKALRAKKRQLFLVYDREDKKLKLWDVSYSLFGELLNKRINRSKESLGWDQFFSSDSDGMTLQVAIEQSDAGKWSEASSIDFMPRDSPVPDDVVEHGHCLDDCLVETPYEQLKSIFLATEDEEDSEPKQESPSEIEKTPEVEEKAEVKEEKKPRHLPTADDFGFKKTDPVVYDGRRCTIMKISPDGTSLTLEDDATEELIRGVGAEDCSKPKAEKKKKKEEEEAPYDKPVEAAAGDDDWDF
jgi:hypothetical protein